VIIENAGISTREFRLAEDNESTITTNVVSTFLLALLLLPKLKETAARFNVTPHLVFVASDTHAVVDLPERKDPSGSIFDTLNYEKKANMSWRYPTSKLLEVLAVREIVATEAPAAYPAVINYVNPGFCHSELMREVGAMGRVIKVVLHAGTTEMGSRMLVLGASAGTASHGLYLSDGKVEEPSKFVRRKEGKKTQERVWHELKAKLEKISPGVTQNFAIPEPQVIDQQSAKPQL
jgi:retinol dehydrogenase 12